jgi:small subunit ribosomal protein S9
MPKKVTKEPVVKDSKKIEAKPIKKTESTKKAEVKPVKETKPAEEKKSVKTSKSKEYIYAVGRRKTATARVRLFPKKGDLIINGMPAGKYFSGDRAKIEYTKPLLVTKTLGKYSFSIKVEGSGISGQIGAVSHGLARALAKFNLEEFRPILKKHGLLTRDSRKKERTKVGTGGKARRKKQSPKR